MDNASHHGLVVCSSSKYYESDAKRSEDHEQPAAKKARTGLYSVSAISHPISRIDRLRTGIETDSPKQKIHKCIYDQCDYSTDKKSHLKQHQQTHLPADQRPRRPKIHKCDHEQCDYSSDRKSSLKKHQQIHLPADQRPKIHKCSHDQCDYSTDTKSCLKVHLLTHLPTDQRPKIHKCGHDQCDYSTDRKSCLKVHLRTHLPADLRPKLHKCDHDQCDYRTDYKSCLKKHQQTHLPADQRPKIHKCDHDQCDYRTDRKEHLKAHQLTHLPFDLRPKRFKIHKRDHDQCDYNTDNSSNLKRHQKANLPIRANPFDDIQIIKTEPACNYWFNVKHRIDNQAPLWSAEPAIKKEYTEPEQNKINRTYFTQAGVPKDEGIRRGINEAISFYKSLNNDDREHYLNERMSVQKHDGSIFSELKNQDEVIATRDLAQWEILGHYAGKHFTEVSYHGGANSMGAALTNIDRYSFSTTPGEFISGFRSGNVTTLINACKTYSEIEKDRSLPEQNVSFIRHTGAQGEWIVFIIALKEIKAGERLWTDYGKDYWGMHGQYHRSQR